MKIAYNAYWFFMLSLLIFVYFLIFFFCISFLLLPFLVNKRCIYIIITVLKEADVTGRHRQRNGSTHQRH